MKYLDTYIYKNVYEIQTVYFKDEREKRNVHVEDISQLLQIFNSLKFSIHCAEFEARDISRAVTILNRELDIRLNNTRRKM